MAAVVSVEPYSDKKIKEFLRSGGQTYVESPSLSDQLTKRALKVDFALPEEDANEAAKNTDSADTTTTTKWGFEAAHRHLRQALTEVSVLGDVLAVSQQRHYIVPDPVVQRPVKSQLSLQLYMKRQALQSAADLLFRGADSLAQSASVACEYSMAPRSSSETTEANHNVSDLSLRPGSAAADSDVQDSGFYTELKRLRRSWRVRRVGSNLIGDLACEKGTRHPFEVLRMTRADGSTHVDVRIPVELHGWSAVRVFTSRTSDVPTKLAFHAPSADERSVTDSWQFELTQAQHAIFCNDLFTQLFAEATQLSSYQLRQRQDWLQVQLQPDICINIVHLKSGQVGTGSGEGDNVSLVEEPELALLLQRRACLLLHKAHFCQPPAVANMPVINAPKPVRWSGPHATSATRLTQCDSRLSLLDHWLDVCQHTLLRRRIAGILDKWSSSVNDPRLTVHWLPATSEREAVATLTMLTVDTKPNIMSSVQLSVRTASVDMVTSNGQVLSLHPTENHVEECVNYQLCIHQWEIVRQIVQYWQWHVVQDNAFQSPVTVALPFTMRVISPTVPITILMKLDKGRHVRLWTQRHVLSENGYVKQVGEEHPMAQLSSSTLAGQLSAAMSHLLLNH